MADWRRRRGQSRSDFGTFLIGEATIDLGVDVGHRLAKPRCVAQMRMVPTSCACSEHACAPRPLQADTRTAAPCASPPHALPYFFRSNGVSETTLRGSTTMRSCA